MNWMNYLLNIGEKWLRGFAPGIVFVFICETLLEMVVSTGFFGYDMVLLFIEGKLLTWAGGKLLKLIGKEHLPRTFYSATGIFVALILCWVGCFVKELLRGETEIYFSLILILLGFALLCVAVIKNGK